MENDSIRISCKFDVLKWDKLEWKLNNKTLNNLINGIKMLVFFKYH